MERKEVREGELGGRHVGLGVGVVICFSFCSAFVRSLRLGGQRPVVRMDVFLWRMIHSVKVKREARKVSMAPQH